MFFSKLSKFGLATDHRELVNFQQKAIGVVQKSNIALHDLIYFFNAMALIDPVPTLSNHILNRLSSEKLDTVLLLKLLGYILNAPKGRRAYTSLAKKVSNLLAESEWRKMPPSQLI